MHGDRFMELLKKFKVEFDDLYIFSHLQLNNNCNIILEIAYQFINYAMFIKLSRILPSKSSREYQE